MSSQWAKCCKLTRRSRVSPQQILTTVMTRIVVDKTIYHAKNTFDLFFTTKISKKRHRLGFESALAALCKWAACTRQTLSDSLQTSLICRNNSKKCLGKEWWHVLVIDKSTYHEKPHFDLFFYHNINDKENVFFSERELKKALRDTLTRAAW